jgi:ribonuclease P protein component
MLSANGFPRAARVRAKADYGRVFEGGRRCSAPALTLHWLQDGRQARLGLAVSRKVDPHAVGRNRIKRQLRECFRQLRATIPDGAYVVVARAPAATLPGPELRAAFVALMRRAGALPPTDPAGTMPGCATPTAKLPEE